MKFCSPRACVDIVGAPQSTLLRTREPLLISGPRRSADNGESREEQPAPANRGHFCEFPRAVQRTVWPWYVSLPNAPAMPSLLDIM